MRDARNVICHIFRSEDTSQVMSQFGFFSSPLLVWKFKVKGPSPASGPVSPQDLVWNKHSPIYQVWARGFCHYAHWRTSRTSLGLMSTSGGSRASENQVNRETSIMTRWDEAALRSVCRVSPQTHNIPAPSAGGLRAEELWTRALLPKCHKT